VWTQLLVNRGRTVGDGKPQTQSMGNFIFPFKERYVLASCLCKLLLMWGDVIFSLKFKHRYFSPWWAFYSALCLYKLGSWNIILFIQCAFWISSSTLTQKKDLSVECQTWKTDFSNIPRYYDIFWIYFKTMLLEYDKEQRSTLLDVVKNILDMLYYLCLSGMNDNTRLNSATKNLKMQDS